MELKKYAKRILKNEPIPNDSRLSYQYYRCLFEDRVALVVYDHEKKKRCNSILRKKQK